MEPSATGQRAFRPGATRRPAAVVGGGL